MLSPPKTLIYSTIFYNNPGLFFADELLRIATHIRPQQEPAKTPSPTRFFFYKLDFQTAEEAAEA